MKILLVEDNVKAADNLACYIRQTFPNITVCSVCYDGNEALNYLQSHEVDMMITDICMPGMDGIELIEKTIRLLPHLRIVVLSAYDYFDYVRKAFILGVKDYLLKPIDRVALAGLFQESKEIGLSSDADYVGRIKKLVDTHLQDQLSLSFISDSLGISTAYCSTIFKQALGENLSSYITRVRLEKSMKLLKDTHLKIYDIAEICGYRETKYFVSVFKKSTGLTPGEYRATLQDKEQQDFL